MLKERYAEFLDRIDTDRILKHTVELGREERGQTFGNYHRAADGQHDPRDLEKLLRTALDKDADMVVGCRPFSVIWYNFENKGVPRESKRKYLPVRQGQTLF